MDKPNQLFGQPTKYYGVCPESIQLCAMKEVYLLKKIEAARNIVRRTITPSPLQSYDLLEEISFIGGGLNQVLSNRSTMFLLLW